ncbi:hypothetical protein [Pseudoramibacter faecis]|uniref:hypothetical protein n=1 Tax=Pseudoramibacter faecis TaxID=3108534 RepID=UPI002E7A4196|nr:hypothetical protein [Pseudoramibacter sp. HA2172]
MKRNGWKLMIALLLMFALAGCRVAAKPESAAENTLAQVFKALKSGDAKTLERLTDDDDVDIDDMRDDDKADDPDDELDDDPDDDSDDFDLDLDDADEAPLLKVLGRHVKYKIRSKKKVADDHVRIRVTVTNVDMTKIVPAWYQKSVAYAAAHRGKDHDETAIRTRMAKSLQTAADRQAKDPKNMVTRRVTVDLQKIGGRWRLVDPRDTFLDTALGGYITAMNKQQPYD